MEDPNEVPVPSNLRVPFLVIVLCAAIACVAAMNVPVRVGLAEREGGYTDVIDSGNHPGGGALSALFIGNSHIFFNELPSILRRMVPKGRQPLYFETSLSGGTRRPGRRSGELGTGNGISWSFNRRESRPCPTPKASRGVFTLSSRPRARPAQSRFCSFLTGGTRRGTRPASTRPTGQDGTSSR